MKTQIKNLLRRMIQGDTFRTYVRPAPPPTSANPDHSRIAICHLIPNLGDAVMVFPLLDAIRRERPGAHITCFTSGIGRILGLHPAVDRIYEFRPKSQWLAKAGPAGQICRIWVWWKRELQNLQFDLCVVVRGGVDPFYSTHLAWLLGGTERVGYSSDLEPERPQGQLRTAALLTREVTHMNKVHEVSRGEEVLMLAELISEPINLNQPVTSILQVAHGADAKAFLNSLPELRTPYAIISPGASTPRRHWPKERFGEFARQEILPRGWLPVFVGGPEMEEICRELASNLDGPSLNLAGKTSDFSHLAAICANAKAFIGNDSGTAHVAGACGVPTLIVTAFAKTSLATHHASPNRSKPLGPLVAVVQPEKQAHPCTEECLADEPHCISQVTVREMRRAFQSLLAQEL